MQCLPAATPLPFPQSLNMMNSTLLIRKSGFGDMLKQINTFFHLSDIYSFNPKIFLPKKIKRNTLNSHVFFDEIGFSSIVETNSELSFDKAVSLSEISQKTSGTYIFDKICYNNSRIEEILDGRERKSHPRLCALAAQSKFYTEVIKRIISTNTITLHVRRGDVAQINADDFPGIFDKTTTGGRIVHCRGLFEKENLETQLPYGNRHRFADTHAHLEILNLTKDRLGIDNHILISDGFDRMSRILINMRPYLLHNENISFDTLKGALERDLHPLMDRAQKTIIGETNSLFYDTIFTALASKVIISQSAGFLRELSNLFDLDIEFISPTPQPER